MSVYNICLLVVLKQSGMTLASSTIYENAVLSDAALLIRLIRLMKH